MRPVLKLVRPTYRLARQARADSSQGIHVILVNPQRACQRTLLCHQVAQPHAKPPPCLVQSVLIAMMHCKFTNAPPRRRCIAGITDPIHATSQGGPQGTWPQNPTSVPVRTATQCQPQQQQVRNGRNHNASYYEPPGLAAAPLSAAAARAPAPGAAPPHASCGGVTHGDTPTACCPPGDRAFAPSPCPGLGPGLAPPSCAAPSHRGLVPPHEPGLNAPPASAPPPVHLPPTAVPTPPEPFAPKGSPTFAAAAANPPPITSPSRTPLLTLRPDRSTLPAASPSPAPKPPSWSCGVSLRAAATCSTSTPPDPPSKPLLLLVSMKSDTTLSERETGRIGLAPNGSPPKPAPAPIPEPTLPPCPKGPSPGVAPGPMVPAKAPRRPPNPGVLYAALWLAAPMLLPATAPALAASACRRALASAPPPVCPAPATAVAGVAGTTAEVALTCGCSPPGLGQQPAPDAVAMPAAFATSLKSGSSVLRDSDRSRAVFRRSRPPKRVSLGEDGRSVKGPREVLSPRDRRVLPRWPASDSRRGSGGVRPAQVPCGIAPGTPGAEDRSPGPGDPMGRAPGSPLAPDAAAAAACCCMSCWCREFAPQRRAVSPSARSSSKRSLSALSDVDSAVSADAFPDRDTSLVSMALAPSGSWPSLISESPVSWGLHAPGGVWGAWCSGYGCGCGGAWAPSPAPSLSPTGTWRPGDSPPPALPLLLGLRFMCRVRLLAMTWCGNRKMGEAAQRTRRVGQGQVMVGYMWRAYYAIKYCSGTVIQSPQRSHCGLRRCKATLLTSDK